MVGEELADGFEDRERIRKSGDDERENGGDSLGDHVVGEIAYDCHHDTVLRGTLTEGNAGVDDEVLICRRQNENEKQLEDIQGNMPTHFGDKDLLEEIADRLEDLDEKLARREDHARENEAYRSDRAHTDTGDELGENVLCRGDGQSKGQIALGGKEVFIKADDHGNGRQEHGDERRDEICRKRRAVEKIVRERFRFKKL